MHHHPVQEMVEADSRVVIDVPADQQRASEPDTRDMYSNTTLRHLYLTLIITSSAQIVVAIAVLCLCALILSMGPTQALMAMCIYSIVHVRATSHLLAQQTYL
jgi:hypothetical protein